MSSTKHEKSEDLFPAILLERRIALDLSKSVIAERLDVTVSAVSHWEAGKHRPPAPKMRILANILHVTVSELAGEVPLSPESRAIGKIGLPRLVSSLETLIEAAQDALTELRAITGRSPGPLASGIAPRPPVRKTRGAKKRKS